MSYYLSSNLTKQLYSLFEGLCQALDKYSIKTYNMAVYVNNITVDTGTNFYRDFYLDNVDGTPLDLTGYTAKSEVRKHPESVGAATTFSVSFVDRSNGLIRLSLE